MQHVPQHPVSRFSLPPLAGMVAQQRQGDIARAAEQRRQVAVALASRGSGPDTRMARASTAAALRTRLTSARTAIARALHGRPVTARTSTIAACCA